MEHILVAVIGAGQAGLSASYWLSTRDIDHVLFDPARPGDSWRARWDSFTLVTPNWTLQLPGHHYEGAEPDGFLVRDDLAQYVADFASSIGPTIIPARVSSLSGGDPWVIGADEGTWQADAVIVATGAYPLPSLPTLAHNLPDEIQQLHSQHYRNPDSLNDGATLVVGSGQSGAQIVDDLTLAGHDVWFAAGNAGVGPRVYRGRDLVSWLYELGFFNNPATDKSRHAASVMVSGRDGGKSLDLRSFGADGVRVVGRVLDASNGTLTLKPNLVDDIAASEAVGKEITSAIDDYVRDQSLEGVPPPDWTITDWEPPPDTTTLDLDAEGITSVVWATGYHYDYSWIDGLAVDRRGYPIQERGITSRRGLYFLGLNQMHTIASSLFVGVGDDAAHVVGAVAGQIGENTNIRI